MGRASARPVTNANQPMTGGWPKILNGQQPCPTTNEPDPVPWVRLAAATDEIPLHQASARRCQALRQRRADVGEVLLEVLVLAALPLEDRYAGARVDDESAGVHEYRALRKVQSTEEN